MVVTLTSRRVAIPKVGTGDALDGHGDFGMSRQERWHLGAMGMDGTAAGDTRVNPAAASQWPDVPLIGNGFAAPPPDTSQAGVVPGIRPGLQPLFALVQAASGISAPSMRTMAISNCWEARGVVWALMTAVDRHANRTAARLVPRRPAFIGWPRSTKKAPSKRGLQRTGATGSCVLPIWNVQSAILQSPLSSAFAQASARLASAPIPDASRTSRVACRRSSRASARAKAGPTRI